MKLFVSAVLSAFMLVPTGLFAQTIISPGLQIGSANTAVADPTVPRPATTPCVVQLFQNLQFANFSPKLFNFTPPAACPGPWAKVVLEADFSIEAGRQFDRTANIWIGGTNVYFGTTAEPSRNVARSWHIERDLTDYSALFKTPQNGRIDLGNLVNSTFTSSLFGNADIAFYPLSTEDHGDSDEQRAPVTADVVLPLSGSGTGGTVFLSSTASTLARTFTLPTNVESAFLDVLAQSQAADEFWYSCVPNDVAAELQDCGSTGFRETEVTIDGQPAGVAPVYPWVYTGGIDPLLWRPIPGVQTLNFVPYRVNLTPFAGILSNGQPHQVSLNVFNAASGFSTTATLLLYLDHGSTQVTGAVTKNTLGAGPSPNITENLTNTNGNITGNVTVTSSRSFDVEGFVRTSHGKVFTAVHQNIDFSNSQDFNITNSVFGQIVTQNTSIASITNTRNRDHNQTDFQKFEWPFVLNFN
ncbi:MAG TPA: peptide-N4-asparagine amidase, partial [Terriglobales bacterium]|nr:peptide-N4-asparagine amidase [Terriglobales bacterium]